MKLSRADSSTLLLAITEGVSQATVTKYGSLSIPEAWARATLDAMDEAASSSLARLLDDSGLGGFIRGELIAAFHEAGCKLPESEVKGARLTSYTEFSDPLRIARKLLNRIQKLPLQYRMITRCSDVFARRFQIDNIEIKISPQLKIVSASNINQHFRLDHDNETINRAFRMLTSDDTGKLKFQDDHLYFEYRCSGYVGDRFSSRFVRDFSDELRAFYGVLISYNVLYDWGFGLDDSPPLIAVNELHDEGSTLSHLERMDTDLVRCTNIDTSVEADRRLKDGATLEELVEPAAEMFRSPEAAKLSTAAIWLLRAHLSSRGMDTILDSTIAMEVLLGDKETSDRIGLSKLMANRCAYSLGKTSAERKEITEFFSTFYRVRSEIVHSGRFKITQQERAVVKKGLDLASRVLRHEVRLSARPDD